LPPVCLRGKKTTREGSAAGPLPFPLPLIGGGGARLARTHTHMSHDARCDVLNNVDLLVNVLRMAGHAHLCDAAARQRALASAGRAGDIEDDDLIAEWLRSSHAECVQLGEAVISVSKRWREAVLRNHSDASWLPEEWVAMKIKRLPLTFMFKGYGHNVVYGVVRYMQLEWQVKCTRFEVTRPELRVISMVCEVGKKTYVLPDNLEDLSSDLDCAFDIDNVFDNMRFGFFVRERFAIIEDSPDMFSEAHNPDGTRVLPCGIGPPLPIMEADARDSKDVVEAVAKYQRLVPEEWEADHYVDIGRFDSSHPTTWTEPLPCPFVLVGKHKGVSRWWLGEGEHESLHLDVHNCTGFFERVELDQPDGVVIFTFRICRKMAFMAKVDQVAGKVTDWARRYEMELTVLDKEWCRHDSRVWCILTPRRCRAYDFLTSFRAYLITHLESHNMSALDAWECESAFLHSHDPCAYNLGLGLHHLMNVTRHHPYAEADDRAMLQSGQARDALRRMWDGYVAWVPGQIAAMMRRVTSS
jgi:hypothetical protein